MIEVFIFCFQLLKSRGGNKTARWGNCHFILGTMFQPPAVATMSWALLSVLWLTVQTQGKHKYIAVFYKSRIIWWMLEIPLWNDMCSPDANIMPSCILVYSLFLFIKANCMQLVPCILELCIYLVNQPKSKTIQKIITSVLNIYRFFLSLFFKYNITTNYIALGIISNLEII